MWGRLVELVDAGDIPAARELHYRLLPLVRALFLEPNPAPVKAALDMLGLDVGDPRLPLLPATDSCRKAIRQQLTGLGLLAGVS
jgi:4-hydroxy-tetrahydrodipicolinate synthase